MKKLLLTSLVALVLPVAAFSSLNFNDQVTQPATSAYANQPATKTASNEHQGFFVEGGFGTLLASVQDSDSLHYASISSGMGGIFSIGYLYNPHFSFEVDALAAGVSGQGSDTDNYGKKTTFKASGGFDMVGPGVKFIATLGKRVMLNFKLGAAYTKISAKAKDSTSPQPENESHSMILPYDAIGLSVALNHQMDFGVSYQGLLFGVANVGVVSGNVTYYFS